MTQVKGTDPTKPIFVAVVVKPEGAHSNRPDGDFAAFVGNDMKTVAAQAIEAANKWSKQNGTEYSVLVGGLTAQVVDVATTFGLEEIA